MTTYAEWVTGVAALTVTGVKRKLAAPPQQVGASDLPLSYPRIPEMSEEVAALTGGHGLTTTTAEIVILVCPSAQSTAATTFATALALIDATGTAYGAAVITMGLDRWTVQQTYESLDGGATVYWALVATVEGSF